MKKSIILAFLLGSIVFSAGVGDIIERNNAAIENERRQQELERRQRELERENFGKEPQIIDGTDEVDTSVRFFIRKIEVQDEYNLLSKSEIKAVTKKYLNRKLSSKDINKLMTDLNNKYIEKGYITTRVRLDETQNLSEGTIRLITIPGTVEGASLNENTFSDRLKVFLSVSKNKKRILRLQDTEQATDQFNRVSSNNVEIKIAPGQEAGGSILQIENQQIRTFNANISYNNYGDDSTGRDRAKIDITKDNLLGINDSLYASYQRGRNKRHLRDDYSGSSSVPPGTIIKDKEDLLPADVELEPEKFNEDWSLNYSFPFRYWTFSTGYSHSYYISSSEGYCGLDETSRRSTQFNLNADRVVYRNKMSKISVNGGLKLKTNQNYFEDVQLVDRRLTIGSLGINYSRGFFGGILGFDLSYDRGLPWFRSADDHEKEIYDPKGRFDKYGLNVNWYKPMAIGKQRFTYRLVGVGQYTQDVLYGSEKISMGDEYTVRGYKGDSISGDKGYYVKNELSYNLNIPKIGSISPYIGYDFGETWNNEVHDIYRYGYIRGFALGVKYYGEILNIDIAYAKPDKVSGYVRKPSDEVYLTFGIKF